MPILARYFLKIYLPLFGLCLALFSAVLLMSHFLKLFNMAVMKGISLLWIAGCFLRLLPFILSLAVPMAYLVALLLALGQLSEHGEIMALRASGFSFLEMNWPFLALGATLSGLLLWLNHKTSPEGFHSFRNQYVLAAQQLVRAEIEPGAFLTIGSWKLFAKETDKNTGRLGGVYLTRREPSGRSMRINAPRGRLFIEKGEAIILELEQGDIQMPNPDPRKLTEGEFEKYRLEVPLGGGLRVERGPDMREMNSSRLRSLVHAPETTSQHRAEYRVEIAVRSAAALSPFVFFWVAVPLGWRMGRYSRGAGFALSLAVLFCFYGLLAMGISLGRRYPGAADAAPWLADAAGVFLGFFWTRRSAAQ